MTVKGNDPLAEMIGRCLSGIEGAPSKEAISMVSRVCSQFVEHHQKQVYLQKLLRAESNEANKHIQRDLIGERDELREKLDRIESIATVGKEHSLLFGKTYAAIGFDKILKECE